jgi:hypothetical protein
VKLVELLHHPGAAAQQRVLAQNGLGFPYAPSFLDL